MVRLPRRLPHEFAIHGRQAGNRLQRGGAGVVAGGRVAAEHAPCGGRGGGVGRADLGGRFAGWLEAGGGDGDGDGAGGVEDLDRGVGVGGELDVVEGRGVGGETDAECDRGGAGDFEVVVLHVREGAGLDWASQVALGQEGWWGSISVLARACKSHVVGRVTRQIGHDAGWSSGGLTKTG